ncbi:hypothetical protein EV13_2056 [Prochlorococcus sp. MIT 0702]|nr:hypothetical protein EV13_2056 [Prochlorococcus sp. MIT 0702]KGG28214.1 hypothetical protein EV12_0964 [Prochlorococcus sp. MIT 0701]KGG37265.1 hypothetical protein EV14_0057 [Prochlorococcus sp. MIT 0703]
MFNRALNKVYLLCFLINKLRATIILISPETMRKKTRN